MAGDWIKLEHATIDKPEILQLADLLNVSQGEALLYCLRLWVWADQQSRNGHALSVTKRGLDRVMRCEGLSNALAAVGWLRGNDGAITLINFDRHNGKTAKERALSGKRKKEERANGHDDVTEMSRPERDKSVTREEKRRDKNISAFALPEWVPADAWKAFEESRKKLRKPLTDPARRLAVSSLDELRQRGHSPQDMIERAVLNGWLSFYEPRGNANQQGFVV